MTKAGTVRRNTAKKENLKKKHSQNIKKQKANQDELYQNQYCIKTENVDLT